MKHDSDILKRIKSYFMRRKSAGEAYDFEREIERDPFLYEAMEGFEEMLTSDIQQALDELDDRLDERSRNGLFSINWKMAASVITVIGIGGLLVMIVFNGNEEKESEVAAESGTDEHYTPRSEQTEFDSLGDYSWALETNTVSNDSQEIIENASYALADEAIPPASAPVPPSEQKLMAPEPNLKKEAAAETAQVEIADAQADEVMFDDAGIAASEPEPLEKVVNEKSMTAAPAQALRSSSMESNAASKSAEEKTSAPGEAADDSRKAAQPKGGMASYNNYLKKNIQTSEGMPKGSVTVTFDLDRSGKPKKLEVANSLCTACDAEAKRLIENGPSWEAGESRERVSVTVEFP